MATTNARQMIARLADRGVREVEAGRPLIRNFQPEAPKANPMVVDFGVNVNKAQRNLTRQECFNLFGEANAIKMNFIPQMLSETIVDYANQILDYCVENRVSEAKKHTRLIKGCVQERRERIKADYGKRQEAFDTVIAYWLRFLSTSSAERYRMRDVAYALCEEQLPKCKHPHLAACVLTVIMLVRFVESYDRQMDELISSKIGDYVRKTPDGYLTLILAMCLSIGEDLGYKLEPSEEMGRAVRSLCEKADTLADAILAEQNEEAANKR